jgi:hypothetical protein
MSGNNHNKNVEEKRKRLANMEAEEKHDKEVKEMTERLEKMFGNVKTMRKSVERSRRTKKAPKNFSEKEAALKKNVEKAVENVKVLKGKGQFRARIGQTLEDGNCFFSAVYRALKERGLLGAVKECHDILNISGSEEDFIRSLRKLTADNANFDDMYSLLEGLYKTTNQNSKDFLKEWMGDNSGLDPKQKAIVKKYILTKKPNKAKFEEEYRAYINTYKTYASDVEFYTVKGLLDFCGITIQSLNEEKDELPAEKNGQPIIYLYNAGNRGEGIHYEYFSLEGLKGGARRKTRRSKNKIVGPYRK